MYGAGDTVVGGADDLDALHHLAEALLDGRGSIIAASVPAMTSPAVAQLNDATVARGSASNGESCGNQLQHAQHPRAEAHVVEALRQIDRRVVQHPDHDVGFASVGLEERVVPRDLRRRCTALEQLAGAVGGRARRRR